MYDTHGPLNRNRKMQQINKWVEIFSFPIANCAYSMETHTALFHMLDGHCMPEQHHSKW